MASNDTGVKDSREELQVVIFTLGDEELAFDIGEVREIVRIPEITRVPKAPRFVEGVINLRGQIKTVLNLKKKLGLKDEVVDKEGKIIIVEKKEQTFGIVVDSVVGVFKIRTEHITDPSSLLGGEKSDFIRGIGRMDDRLVIILEAERLFSLEEMALS